MTLSVCAKSNLSLGLPDDVISAVHLCCGYPTYCDQDDYMKAKLYIPSTLNIKADTSKVSSDSQKKIKWSRLMF